MAVRGSCRPVKKLVKCKKAGEIQLYIDEKSAARPLRIKKDIKRTIRTLPSVPSQVSFPTTSLVFSL